MLPGFGRLTGRPGEPPPRCAVLDLGTNTALCTVLFADARDPRALRVAEELHFVTGLGRGRLADEPLSLEGMERAHRSLRYIARRLDELGVPPAATRGAATAACREAPNGARFLSEVRDALGLGFETVTGAREAELVEGAQARTFPGEQLTVLDIGGGSTELVRCGEGGGRRSMPVGASKLLSRLGPRGSLDDAQSLVRALLGAQDLPEAVGRLVGVSGTVTTLRAVLDGQAVWDPSALEGRSLHRSEVTELADRLFSLTPADRRALPGLHPLRADALGPSALWLAGLMERLGRTELTVSDRGVRFGLLWEAWPRSLVR